MTTFKEYYDKQDVVDEHGSRSSDRFNSKNAYRSAKGKDYQASLKRQAAAKRRMKADKNKPKVPSSHSAYRLPEDRHTDSEDIIRGTLEIAGDTLIVNVHDVEDRIDGLEFKNFSTGETQTSKIRVRAQMERLLRKMGYDVEAPGKRGKLQVQILWPDATGREQHEFKLIPKPFNAAFARQPRSVQ